MVEKTTKATTKRSAARKRSTAKPSPRKKPTTKKEAAGRTPAKGRGKKTPKKEAKPAVQASSVRPEGTTDRYFEGIGRRKTAVARVKLFTRGDRSMTVNNRPLDSYFPTERHRLLAREALSRMNVEDKFRVVAVIRGGGISAQAEAMRHGSARALIAFNSEFRKRLKRVGYLTRDARRVERKKPGLKKARRAPQWSKR